VDDSNRARQSPRADALSMRRAGAPAPADTMPTDASDQPFSSGPSELKVVYNTSRCRARLREPGTGDHGTSLRAFQLREPAQRADRLADFH